MFQIIPLTKQNTLPYNYQDREVDNDGFFQTMEEWLSSIQWAPEIWKQTRSELFELKWLLAHMKKQKFIRGITEWTASEQKSFFEKVQSEVMDVGVMASMLIREKIQLLIEDEIWREINDDGKKYSLQDGSGNTMIPNMGEYQQFLDTSFLLAKETTIIPLDLRLTISKSETIQDAKKKLDRYHGKYNALILVDEKNHPIGVIQAQTIQQYEDMGHTTLEWISVLSGAFGHYTTTSNELKNSMQEYGINILPIIDSKTGILIGILTSNSLVKKEVQYYSATSLTELSLDYLKMAI